MTQNRLLCFSYLLPVFILVSCSNPGTLGAVANTTLECSESTVSNEIGKWANYGSFKPKEADSTAVNWWKEGGFDFLNYHCLYLKKELYMVSINSSSNECDIAIRALYEPQKKNWLFATDFDDQQIKKAELGMKILVSYIYCE
jgi:hypothetical protein